MIKPTFREENKLWKNGYKYVAGIDEVGRGAWAGPLVAAGVIFPTRINKEYKQITEFKKIRDSKLLDDRRRKNLYQVITKSAITWGISIFDNKKIDSLGLARINRLIISRVVRKLRVKPDYLLIDNTKINRIKIPYKLFIDGDAHITSIAAASIIAKVIRDRLMNNYHKIYPVYGFNKHKGYGTKLHQKMIKKYGVCQIHRKSYKPIQILTKLQTNK